VRCRTPASWAASAWRTAFANPAIERVTAYVIEGLTAARNYCLKLGFQFEGIRRNACRQNGRLLGVHILGMTRNDWEKSTVSFIGKRHRQDRNGASPIKPTPLK
jgi:hypothetical protein